MATGMPTNTSRAEELKLLANEAFKGGRINHRCSVFVSVFHCFMWFFVWFWSFFFSAHKYSQAIDLYTQAIEANNDNAVYWANRAFAHTKLEEYGSAILDSTKAIEIDPKYSKVKFFYFFLGFCFSNRGQYKLIPFVLWVIKKFIDGCWLANLYRVIIDEALRIWDWASLKKLWRTFNKWVSFGFFVCTCIPFWSFDNIGSKIKTLFVLVWCLLPVKCRMYYWTPIKL